MDIIHDVTRRGDVESLRRILTANPDFHLADPKFTSLLRTPLHVAAILGYVEFASEISSIDPQLAMEVDAQGCTPLHLASIRKNVEMVSVLINANPNACVALDQNGGTPLHLAAMRDEIEVMELLIQSRPEAIHQVLPNTKETILHLCVKNNMFAAMEKLVDYLVTNRENLANNPDVISVNSVDSGGNTILHLAAQMKRMTMLRYLIWSDDIGIDINIRNNEELTALHMLDRNEMNGVELSWYGYQHATEEVPQQDREVPQQDREVPLQSAASNNEWLKERLNTIMIVAALIAAISYQAVVNPPGGVFQDDSKIDSSTDPIMFTYYLKNVIGTTISEGFESYINKLPPQNTTGNITADDEIVTYRSNFVKNLLTAANSESLVGLMFPYVSKKLGPGIVLEDDWLMNITSDYNSTVGGGSGFSPYLIRYAGTAVLAYISPKAYESFILLNSLSLLVCASTILILTFDAIKQHPSGSTTKQHPSEFTISIVGYLEILLAIAVVCLGLSYTIVVKTMGPPFYRHHKLDIKLNIMGVGVMIIQSIIFVYSGISLHPQMRRGFIWLSFKWMVLYMAIISLRAYFS
ncbi:hypothetical protein MKW98_012795 [Papaver atlanticum]|uniref:PGG domain-containing protein n=1 Tax=Papaver atlanticum TaxID=357466 RepID=A0AAD4XI52_9MAGN|nr:hypothetical protein MKW98_012795 [Papaver atlanticum]